MFQEGNENKRLVCLTYKVLLLVCDFLSGHLHVSFLRNEFLSFVIFFLYRMNCRAEETSSAYRTPRLFSGHMTPSFGDVKQQGLLSRRIVDRN